MDPLELRKHKLRNTLQSLALLCAMAALLAALGWAIAGATGVMWALAAAIVLPLLTPTMSPRLVLNLYRARPLASAELDAVAAVLAERAELATVPELYYLPSAMINAFAVGTRNQAAIAVTDGMLRRLPPRQLVAVLAHEMSHIRNNDMFVMGLADLFSRMTGSLSTIGQLLLVLNLPLMLFSDFTVSWLAIALLIFAPMVSSLMQLALSRTREYDADLEAVSLTGDPEALASALAHMERYQGRLFEQIMLPGRRVPDPSLLRTHPPTAERLRRLRALAGRRLPDERDLGVSLDLDRIPRVYGRPRWHMHGLWY